VGLDEQTVEVTGFTPGEWGWASTTTAGVTATLAITTSDVYTVNLLMREDGLRIDRLLLTTDTTYTPTGFGPAETERQLGGGGLITPLTRTIVYTYDNLYRLTDADYSTGETYQYSYDPVGNRLEQVINGDTTEYLYDAANRLAQLDGQAVYSFDNNGNLLNSDTLTNTFDAANRLVETQRDGTLLEPIYNGVNDRVGQVTAGVTTTFALDIASGLPEVIYTSEGNVYLHLPGVIMAESSIGDVRYLLSDGLGSVRQAVDENGEVVAYNEFDPYGNPNPQSLTPDPYGFTGEWWENEVGLLHLRARWYWSETGTFLSRDPVESEPPYQYVRGNPVNLVDPSGFKSIGVFYDGKRQPLIDRIIGLHGSWRIEKNLFGNNLFRDGVVRFGDYVLKIALPETTAAGASTQDTIGPPFSIAPSSFHTILYFQGMMNVASYNEDIAYRIGYPVPGNSLFARPGIPPEYININISPTGYASYTGGKIMDDLVIDGASPATTSFSELAVFNGVNQGYPGPGAMNTVIYSGFGPYETEGFIGNTQAMATVGAINALGLVNSFFNTPPIGLRRYQLLLQENQASLACAGVRYQVVIQTYQLMVYPTMGQVNLRSAHLSVSPDGTFREKPFNSMIYNP
jgi:RHS repeat-associated protein